MKNKRIGIVGNNRLISSLFKTLGNFPERFDIDKPQRYYDAVVWGGGPDVSPYYYHETPLPATQSAPFRDEYEKVVFDFLEPEVPKIGICRGAQFLCVMAGGSLWQDVDGHHENHYAYDEQAVPHLVTSTHHQMMRPPTHAVTLLTAARSSYYQSSSGIVRPDTGGDIEAIWIQENQIFAFQPHPEYGMPSCQRLFTDYLRDLYR